MIGSRHRSADAAVRLLDLTTLAIALPVAYETYVNYLRPGVETQFDRYWPGLVGTLLLWGATSWLYQVYEARNLSLLREVTRAVRAFATVAVIVAAVLFATKIEHVSRLLTGVYFLVAFALLVANRVLLRLGARVAGTTAGQTRHVAVVGTGEQAKEIVETIRAHPEWSMQLVGYIAEDDAVAPVGSTVLGRLSGIGRILEEQVLDTVIFAVPRERIQAIEPAVKLCEEQGVGAMISLDVLRFGYSQMSVDDMDGLPMLSLARTPTDVLALAAKRLFDVVVSLGILMVMAPVLACVAIAIKLDSPGPIFFRQRRVGLQGRLFPILKFRSMYVDAEQRLEALRAHNEMSGPVFKMKNDPRVTRIGRFIRKTSLDEFPQFWNVLVGDMSIVGPRPPLPSEVRQYKRWQRRRLSVRPGITCIWQISGRNSIDFDRWMELDLEYIDGWSLWGDIQICLKTIPAVLASRGAS